MSDSGKHGNRRRGTMPLLSWGALGVLGVTLSAAAALGAFALTQRSATPAALAESGDDAVLRSTPTRVDDRRRIELVPDLRPAVAGRAPRAGTLTTFTCTPGRTVRTGSVLASVDGKDLLAISTSVPLWRDLSPGVSGADVTALQKALRKLRPELVVTRRYDTQTRRALGEIYAKAGLDRAQTTLRRDSVIWLAPGATRIASCNAGLGQQVNAGQELFVMERTVRSFRVKTVPDDLVAGARRLTLEKAKVNLKGLGAIAEPPTSPGWPGPRRSVPGWTPAARRRSPPTSR